MQHSHLHEGNRMNFISFKIIFTSRQKLHPALLKSGWPTYCCTSRRLASTIWGPQIGELKQQKSSRGHTSKSYHRKRHIVLPCNRTYVRDGTQEPPVLSILMCPVIFIKWQKRVEFFDTHNRDVLLSESKEKCIRLLLSPHSYSVLQRYGIQWSRILIWRQHSIVVEIFLHVLPHVGHGDLCKELEGALKEFEVMEASRGYLVAQEKKVCWGWPWPKHMMLWI